MNPWLSMWFKNIYWPLSGGVDQDISAWANLFSPQIDFNIAGNLNLEKNIVQNVASYGTQLSLLLKVVNELSQSSQTDAATELKGLVKKIDTAKELHKDKLYSEAKDALQALERYDPKAYQALLDNIK
ncbi:hypothetical protein [Vibrio viridaestus]|uniref:Uncharacterized protein n=1 Tax=Vibrio viridaestus TaxID=2487322 RepID=A0A3N9TLH5_9VIBR|nr:hypothetical protein [Vibrio viridaestus]RQW64981.1 hypothetical protein EES38_02790 [Vibrio viridaestus]